MEGSVLSFLKAEWKVSDTGSAQFWASSFLLSMYYQIQYINNKKESVAGSKLLWLGVQKG